MSDIRVHPIDNKHIAWTHRVVDNFFSEKEASCALRVSLGLETTRDEVFNGYGVLRQTI